MKPNAKPDDGQTPWEDWDRPAMIRELARMYMALVSARSTLKQVSFGVESEPYWREGGVGGRTLTKAREVLDPYRFDGDGGERIYRAFMRNAVDLLFETDCVRLKWMVCENCTCWWGSTVRQEPAKKCMKCGKVGLRPLTWEDIGRPDLKPKES